MAQALEPAVDVLIVGAGLIGMALARELDRAGLRVCVLEKHRAGQGASWAGAGMLAAQQMSTAALRPWAAAAAAMYPDYVSQLESEAGESVGWRPSGTIFLAAAGQEQPPESYDSSLWHRLAPSELRRLEPELDPALGRCAWSIADHSVDNRRLVTALAAALRRRGVPIVEGATVQQIAPDGAGWRVLTNGATHVAAAAVNAAGAWSDLIAAPATSAVRPRKGQMLAVDAGRECLRAVVHSPEVYLVPRAGGRVLIGATVENVGFDDALDESALQRLQSAAVALVPCLKFAPVVERWCGFRPGSDDGLPRIGETGAPGYWLATGHFRDGILLAPLTARVLARALGERLGARPLPALPSGINAGQFRPPVPA